MFFFAFPSSSSSSSSRRKKKKEKFCFFSGGGSSALAQSRDLATDIFPSFLFPSLSLPPPKKKTSSPPTNNGPANLPTQDDIPTYVIGVNAQDYKHSDKIISNASCTTNCLAPFVKVLDEKFGIVKGTMTTTHSYTGDQRLLDASHRDLRRARAAALNIVPTTTGAAKAVALVLPRLKGKLNGIALRVPTPNVSVVDLVIQVEKKTFAEEVNAAFREAAAGPMKGVLHVSDEPLVSKDFACTDQSTSIDSSLTMVMGDDMVKVVAWYDNEWGYSQRVVDLAELTAQKWE